MYRNRALEIPGFGIVPCSKRLEKDFTNKAELLAIVQNDDNDDNPPYSSHIWVTRTKVNYAGDWDEFYDEEEELASKELCAQTDKSQKIYLRQSKKNNNEVYDKILKQSITMTMERVGVEKYLHDLVYGLQVTKTEDLTIVKKLFPELLPMIESLELEKELGQFDRYEKITSQLRKTAYENSNESFRVAMIANVIIVVILIFVALIVNGGFKSCSSYEETPTNEDIRMLQPIHPL